VSIFAYNVVLKVTRPAAALLSLLAWCSPGQSVVVRVAGKAPLGQPLHTNTRKAIPKKGSPSCTLSAFTKLADPDVVRCQGQPRVSVWR
jgi:hypothetical protein